MRSGANAEIHSTPNAFAILGIGTLFCFAALKSSMVTITVSRTLIA